MPYKIMMKKYLILVIIIIVLLAAGGTAGYSYWQKIKEDRFLSNNPQTKASYELIKKREEEIRKNKNDYNAYMSLAFNWKGIGEATRNDKYLRQAASIYDAVIKRWGAKAYLPFLNQANVYIELKEYARAERNLKISLDIDPGEQNLYVALADLYRNYMSRDSQIIKSVYEQGIKRVVGGGNLVVNYASYLNDIGDYTESLKYYKMLAQAYPNNGYQTLVKELEEKINNAQ